MTRMISGRCIYMALAVLLVSGCATMRKNKVTASETIQAAQAKLRVAHQSMAPTHAPHDYKRAQNRLHEAQSQFDRKKYKEATESANQSISAAQTAEDKTKLEKTRIEKERLTMEEKKKQETLKNKPRGKQKKAVGRKTP